MATLVIRNLPGELQRKLREDAVLHRRSVNEHVVAILAATSTPAPIREYPPPFRMAVPLADAFLAEARRRGRA